MAELGPLSSKLRRVLSETRAGLNDQQNLMDPSAQEMLGRLADWISDHDARLQWNGSAGLNGVAASALAPAAGVRSVNVDLVLTDSNNSQNMFDQATSVTVTITGGTAAGKQIGNVPQAGLLSPAGATINSMPVSSSASTQPSWNLPTATLSAGPITVTMQDGKAVINAVATGAGTLILGLSAPSKAGLDVTDVLTITYS